jgi:hypothetical protein
MMRDICDDNTDVVICIIIFIMLFCYLHFRAFSLLEHTCVRRVFNPSINASPGSAIFASGSHRVYARILMHARVFLSIIAFRLVTPAFNCDGFVLHWMSLIALIALIALILNLV